MLEETIKQLLKSCDFVCLKVTKQKYVVTFSLPSFIMVTADVPITCVDSTPTPGYVARQALESNGVYYSVSVEVEGIVFWAE